MRVTASPTRRHHDTTSGGAAAAQLWLAAIAVLGGGSAFGQTAIPCTAIENDADRLACYDRALRAPAPAPRAGTPAPAVQPSAAAPTRSADPAPLLEQRTRARTVRETVAPSTNGVLPAGDGVVPIVIVNSRALPGRPMTFVAEDGTTWVQTDSQRVVGLPDTPFAAEIRPGAMGSSFLVPAGRGRAIRVRAAEQN